MERNTLTTMSQLKIGDRFFKANDKHKNVFEKIDHLVLRTYFQTYTHWAISASVLDVFILNENTIARHARAFKSDTPVIFLRHKPVESEQD
ncbi:MAG TPA: hypothetical protein VG847_00990 [Chitinophagaceae bacterium]|nr:hypothetical protein [Chitinophagaceae bacterium]